MYNLTAGEETHNKKRSKNTARGKKPINKNVIVVDKNNNEIGSTYVKRAKGLVKKGRARFIDENKICIADISENDIIPFPCPPSTNIDYLNYSEENKMDEKIIINSGANETKSEETKETALTVESIVARIDAIAKNTSYLESAIESLSIMSDGNSGECGAPGDISGQAKAQAIGEAVAAREETNRKLMEFYQMLYCDMSNTTSANVMNFVLRATEMGLAPEVIDSTLAIISQS